MMRIPEKWQNGPPTLSGPRPVRDPVDVLQRELKVAYWTMLAYQHDAMAVAVDQARGDCVSAAQRLRQLFDNEPRLGPEAADVAIAWAVHYAEQQFAADLARAAQEAESGNEVPGFLRRRSRSDWRSRRDAHQHSA